MRDGKLSTAENAPGPACRCGPSLPNQTTLSTSLARTDPFHCFISERERLTESTTQKGRILRRPRVGLCRDDCCMALSNHFAMGKPTPRAFHLSAPKGFSGVKNSAVIPLSAWATGNRKRDQGGRTDKKG